MSEANAFSSHQVPSSQKESMIACSKQCSAWFISGSLLWLTATLLLLHVGSMPSCAGAEPPQKEVQVDQEPLTLGGLTFTPDSNWKSKTTPRPMSAGGYTFVGGEKEVDADFYYFGEGQGGSLEQNIERWKGQFEERPEPKIEELKIGAQELKLLTFEGTFLSGSAFGPKTAVPNSKMLQAVIPVKDSYVFIRVVGDTQQVTALKEKFIVLISSALKGSSSAN